ncbi:MAG: DUF512 domain-containing protein [Candidatus Limiplasma sp.]|nr:DUF512 domain-containing protein [Candidatus Limiplasma sp.]
MHRIAEVQQGSVAFRHGLAAGDAIAAMNGEPLLDEIDYQALSFPARVSLEVERADGRRETVVLRKEEGEPLGLRFEESMALCPRTCRNKCVFCFIDQMPPGLRKTLYVKDDDWRYSLMMGNFVTLTNVNEAEFERIIRRRASPLYVSVHTTDPDLRRTMTRNRFAGDIMERLTRLAEAGIRFHCQIVVCPGYNDGPALLRTLEDLRSLAPAALSAALVPVGMTKFREGLAPLKPFDRAGALKLLEDIAPFQERCRGEVGTTFAFPSDEFFCLAGKEIPPEAWYEGYPQIENGVGLLRLLEGELEEAQALEEEGDRQESSPEKRTLLIATGVSAAPHLQRLTRRFAPEGTTVKVQPVVNHFFGETVTVAGLLTGCDLLEQLPAQWLRETGADTLLIPGCMLRHEGDRFLDDMTLEEFASRLPLPVKVVGGSGQDLYDALRGR